MKKIVFSLTVLCLAASGFSVSAQQDRGAEDGLYVPGAVYVKFKTGSLDLPKSESRHVPVSALFPAVKAESNPYGLQARAYSLRMNGNSFLENTFRIDMDSLSKFGDFIKTLQSDSRIELVERVPMPRIQRDKTPAARPGARGKAARRASALPGDSKTDSVPTDKYYGIVGGISTSWHLEQIGFPEIYGKYVGNPEIRVAVVDNAIWGKHPDLQLDSVNMYDAYNDTLGNSAPPRYVGQNQPGTAQNPSSAYLWSHGTHCAGLVGAITDNEEGIASIGSGVTLVGVKAASDNTSDALPRSVEGAIWASEHDVDVISMSFGSEAYSGVEARLYTAMVQQGIVLLAAAGNDGRDVPNYPADYAGVIAVGSLNEDGSRSSFSNYGSWVDVWTPGGYVVENGNENRNIQVFSTTYCVNNTYSNNAEFMGVYYDAMGGTSMATPLTSGAVALILSYYPGLNGYQMLDLLQRSARDGCLYVPAALEYMETLPSRQVRNMDAAWKPSTQRAVLSWEAPEEDGAVSYRICMNGETVGETPNLFYEWTLEDTTGVVGVAAIYEDAELPVYGRFRADEHLANQSQRIRPEQIFVQVDALSKTVELPVGLEFDRVEIYNMQGALMLSVPAGTTVLDMSSCAKGLYVGRAIKDGFAVPFKFVL